MKLLALSTLVLLLLPPTLDAQWIEANRKQSQAVKGNGALIVHQGTMYFWNEENHFQISTDNGVSWIDPSDEISGANPHVVRMSASGDRIYAALNFGTGNGMPIYSTDRGTTWLPDTAGAPRHALGWAGHPVVANIVTWGRWVYVKWDQPNGAHHIKTVDGTWTPNAYLSTPQNHPSSLLAKGDTLFALSSKLVYTTDGGANWVVPANTGFTGFGGQLYADGSRLYVFAYTSYTEPATLFYTDDNGETWSQIDVSALMVNKTMGGGFYFPSTAFFRGNRIEFSTAQETFNTPPNVWRSTDLGATWARDTAGLPTAFAHSINAFAYTPDGSLWAVRSHENIYRQQIDGGTSGVEDRRLPVEMLLSERRK